MNDLDDFRRLQLNVNEFPPEEAVSRLVEHAAELHASDLFFVTNENHVAVMARHLGMLRLLCIMPSDLGRRCMAHIKAVAGMDVMERRRPLDGRWVYQRPNGAAVDLRLNTLPTLYGEDFTLRLLERDSQLLAIDALGMLRQDYNRFLQMMNSPSGLILVTGPTGAGKTVTLYASMTY